LRSWQPRSPSAKLKRRLFGTPAGPMPKMAWLLGSLAPATACALLTLSIFSAGNGFRNSASTQTVMIFQQPRLRGLYAGQLPDEGKQLGFRHF
jgi:hypothetical protein